MSSPFASYLPNRRQTLMPLYLRKALVLCFLLFSTAHAQLPPPPPFTPEAVPGEAEPFDPNDTKEASPMKPFEILLPGQTFSDTPLTLVDLIQFAWENQPDILQARGDLRSREGAVTQARSAILPTIDVTSTYSHITTNSGGSGGGTVIVGNQVIGGTNGAASATSDRLFHRIGFNQLLFDFGRNRSLIKQADLLRQASVASLLATQNDVALQVKVSYYSYTLSGRLLEISEDDLANRQQQLALARALYDAGEMAPGDVVRAQSAVTASVVALNQAQLSRETARQNLLLNLGVPPLQSVELVHFHEPDLPQKELTYLLETAQEKRPDVLAAERTVEARKAGLGAAHALNRPELSTFTGITYQGPLDGRQYPTLTAQLSIAFDIYDGGARAGAVTSAEGALLVAEAQYLRTTNEVQASVARTLAQLLTAEQNVVAAQAGVESAREGVRIAEGRYRVALGTLTDVLDAQRAFVGARTDLANSQNALDLARARTRHVLAAPLEEGFPVGFLENPASVPERGL